MVSVHGLLTNHGGTGSAGNGPLVSQDWSFQLRRRAQAVTIPFLGEGDVDLDMRIQPAMDLAVGSEVPGQISLHSAGSAANAA
jgi:hypothetical protein